MRGSAHQLPLVAEAESADGPQGGGAAVQDARVSEAGLPVPAVLPQQQHVGQVRDVARGQAQRLDLGELPFSGLCGDERAQRSEGRVHAVRSVPLPRVGRLPLFAHPGETPVSPATAAAAPPPSPSPVTGLPLTRVPARAAVSGGLPVRAVAAAVQVLQVGGEAVVLRVACGLHPLCAPRCSSLTGASGAALHITLSSG